MTPAKKKSAANKKPPPEKVAVPVPTAAVPVPQPVLTAKEQRFWKVIQTKNLIGGTMFLLGVGFCIGFWFSDRAHGFEKWALGVGLFLIIFGAHFMSSEPTERALGALARTAVKVIPTVKRGDDGKPPTGEGG